MNLHSILSFIQPLQAEITETISTPISPDDSFDKHSVVALLHGTKGVMEEILKEMRSSREESVKERENMLIEMRNNGDALKDIKACLVEALNEVKGMKAAVGGEYIKFLAPSLY